MTSGQAQNSGPTGTSVRCSGVASVWREVGAMQHRELLVGRRPVGDIYSGSALQRASRCRVIPRMEVGHMSTNQKQSPIIRIAVLENPETKRKVMARVTQGGKLGKRDAQHLGVKKVAAWIEVEAKSWSQATRAVKAGRGRKVAP